MITWHYISSDIYDEIPTEEKTLERMFFLYDTKQIYRGTENFTNKVIIYTELPKTGIVGRMYLNKNTLEGNVYNGKFWVKVIYSIQEALITEDDIKPLLYQDDGISMYSLEEDDSNTIDINEPFLKSIASNNTVAIQQQNLDDKMHKVSPSDVDEVIIASSTGDSNASGKKLGTNTFSENNDTLATEAGAVEYVSKSSVLKSEVVETISDDPSDDKVASAKSIIDCLTWKTTI